MADTPPDRVKHQVLCHLDVLREAAGVTRIDDRGLEMWLPEEAEQQAERLWQEHILRGEDGRREPDAAPPQVVAFNIGASWATKRWPADYFAACADALLREGYDVLFLGGPTDVALVEGCTALMEERQSPRLHVLTGKVSLAVLAGLLERSCLFLTTDSGPMHVGVAMNVPIVTMFGASPVPTFYPYDAKDILIKTPESCHPCGIHDCPKKGAAHMACMKHIPVAVVMRYVHELLAAYGGRPARELPRSGAGSHACRIVEL